VQAGTMASMNQSVGACFAQVVARFPRKAAIEYEGVTVSYSELDAAANAVARRLLAGALRSPAHVALLFDNRIAAITAIMGVLKAGHAYVPLDSADPDERARFILRDCEPGVVITDDAHLARAQRLLTGECRLINIDRPGPAVPEAPLPAVSPETPAYVFYTSGSTGQPKGVCQNHRNLLYFAGCYGSALRLTDQDRLSLLYSLSFSAANMDIYGGLLNGATICAYDIRRHGIAPLADWLDKERITVLHTVPTVFRQLTKTLDPHRGFGGIRAVDLGGETVFASDVPLFRRHFKDDCLLVNHLAATEASVIAQYVVDRNQAADGGDMLPVGRSPEGVRVRIRRPDGAEAAVDEVGEIVVSSPFISPGYWRRPELNAAAFSAHPDQPGWRVYRTGDMGRLTPDGNLLFLGRTGTRVKIRGQSVDLTEVEAALRQCVSVRDAAVTADQRDDQPEADRMVAYVVAAPTAGRDPKIIRRELAERLPQYMLPSAYVFLDALPQTATGKIDKRALPAVQAVPDRRGGDFQPPRDDLEKQIASVFETILKYAPVGRTDDFFLIGGDSLSGMELKIHLTNIFGNNVPELFEDATVAGVADAMRRLASRPAGDARLMPVLRPLREKGGAPILFLVHGRQGQAFVSPRFLELLGEDQPVYVFQARGVDGIQAPHTTIEAMARDYVEAMRSVQAKGPYFLGALCVGGYVAIEMARVLRGLGEQVCPLLLIDTPAPPFSAHVARTLLNTLGSLLKRFHEQGKIDFDFKDPNRRKGARRVAVTFQNALFQYKPKPYARPVFLLASRYRLSAAGWGNSKTLKAHFSGDIRLFEVAGKHNEMLDTHNEDFVRYLAQCLKSVRAAFAAMRP
jgi:amino acid adenylation domain-containing protein